MRCAKDSATVTSFLSIPNFFNERLEVFVAFAYLMRRLALFLVFCALCLNYSNLYYIDYPYNNDVIILVLLAENWPKS